MLIVVRFSYTIILAQNTSDGYISRRQRIDTSLRKNEKTAFKLVV